MVSNGFLMAFLCYSYGFAILIKRIEIAVVLRTRCLFYSSSHLKVPVSVSVFVARDDQDEEQE